MQGLYIWPRRMLAICLHPTGGDKRTASLEAKRNAMGYAYRPQDIFV